MSLSKDTIVTDELVEHVVTRKSRDRECWTNRTQTKDGQKIYDYIPLLLNDLKEVSPLPGHAGVFTAFHAPYKPLHFRCCILHAFVAGQCVHNQSFYKYIIDDGTGTIEIGIYCKAKERQTILQMHNETLALGQSDKKIAACLQRLLAKSLEHVDASVITAGSNLLLSGRPNFYRGNVGLDVFSFSMDNSKSRKQEIVMTDYLIDWYKRHRIKNS